MPKFKITEGDKSYMITVPEGTSQEQAYGYLKQHLGNQQQPETTGTAGLVARGAARGLAGNVADAARLAETHGVGGLIGAPAQAWRLARMIPGVSGAEKKLEEFADAPTPSGAEYAGWLGSQAIPAFIGPELGVARSLEGLAKSGLQKAGKWASKKIGKETAERVGEKATAETAAKVAPKPKLRLKADGSVVEVDEKGNERAVRQWTKRQMEKRALRAQGQPTSSTAPQPGVPWMPGGPEADYQAIVQSLGQHGAWEVAKHMGKAMGIPAWSAMMIMSRTGRSIAGRGIRSGVATTGRTISGENPPNDRNRTEGPIP